MEELCKKYPALEDKILVVEIFAGLRLENKMKDEVYANFKKNISCIGLEPEEYETVIKWFCDTMEY